MKKILSNSSLYIASVLFSKGINFALLPILTHYLTKEDYGILALLMAIVTISSIYIGFFPQTFIITRYAQYGKEKISEYMHSIMLIIISSYMITLFILLLFQNVLLPDTLNHKSFMLFAVSIYALFSVLFNMIDTILQVEKNALKFATLQTIQSLSAASLTLLLVIEFSSGWMGKFFSELFVLGTISIYTIFYIIKHNYYRHLFDVNKIKELLNFLFPLSFNVLGLYILGTVDRIFISNFIGLEAAGIYAVAIAMAFVVNMVYDSIVKAINPFFNEYLAEGSKEGRWKAVKLTYLYSLMCLIVLTGFLLLLPYVFHWMIDPKFQDALRYIPLLAIALTFEGLRKILSGFYTFYGKVKTIASFTIFTAILNIILNYFLINAHGIMGAVESILITFILLYVITLVYLVKYFNLPLKGL